MNTLKKVISIIVFFVILIIIIFKLGDILKPEWNDEWIDTSIVKDFYNLKENSIDVLAVGSSQVIKGFSALELYKNYGITAYGLGTEQQAPINSYAWIKESLKTQNEKIVLFETRMLFEETPEPQNRKGIDNMKFSLNKIEFAYYDSIERNSFENFVSILFPITRFHSRWTEVLENQKETEIVEENYPNYLGYSLSNKVGGVSDYTTLDETVKTEEQFVGNRKEHLIKMINYCKENNIELIMYKNPDKDWTMEKHNSVQKIADEYDVPYIDFNVKNLSEEIGFNYETDCEPLNHLNIFGAQEVTNYLGNYIFVNYKIEDKRNLDGYDYFEEKLEEYDDHVVNKKLVNIFNPTEYIETLQNDALSLIICKNSNFTDPISDEFKYQIASLGIDTEKMISNQNYCAIIESGEVKLEEGSNDIIHFEETLSTGENVVLDTENMAGIYFENLQYSNSHAGINILVYNHKNKQIVECSYLDFEQIYGRLGR